MGIMPIYDKHNFKGASSFVARTETQNQFYI